MTTTTVEKWFTFYSEKEGREYYYNPKRKLATWILPDNSHPIPLDDKLEMDVQEPTSKEDEEKNHQDKKEEAMDPSLPDIIHRDLIKPVFRGNRIVWLALIIAALCVSFQMMGTYSFSSSMFSSSTTTTTQTQLNPNRVGTINDRQSGNDDNKALPETPPDEILRRLENAMSNQIGTVVSAQLIQNVTSTYYDSKSTMKSSSRRIVISKRDVGKCEEIVRRVRSLVTDDSFPSNIYHEQVEKDYLDAISSKMFDAWRFVKVELQDDDTW